VGELQYYILIVGQIVMLNLFKHLLANSNEFATGCISLQAR